MLDALLRLIPVLLRHVAAYGDLLSDELLDELQELRRQLLGLALLLSAGIVAALIACLWVIALSWDGPHRLQTIGALCIGFSMLALSGAWYATSATAGGRARPFQRLSAEWREDLRQLAALYPPANGAAAPDIHGD